MTQQQDATPTTPTTRARGRKTVADMVRSLAVVLVLVGIVVAFNVAQQPDPVVRDVDYAAALSQARAVTTYDVLGPEPLPDGWRATSARTGADGGATWHIGLVTAGGRYAAVEQTDGSRRDFVDRFADGARPAGTLDIAGAAWQRLEGGSPERRALVRTSGGVTTVVAGSATWSELARLVQSLRAG